MKKKIAIYCRQSVENQESLSVNFQEERCRGFIQSKFTDEKIEVYTDKGFSGSNTNRPEFSRMMDELEKDRLKMVIVYRLDRIGRNVKDYCIISDIFKEHNVQFCSISENFDENTLKLFMVIAEKERESIIQRVTDNYYDRITKDGRWAGGPAPYGFNNGRTTNNVPTLVANENIKAVELMFKEYATAPNVSLHKVGVMLTNLGYKSIGRTNGAWDNVTVRRILSNPVYAVADERLHKYFKVKKIQCLNDGEWDGTTSCHIVGKEKKKPKVYLTNIAGIIDSRTFIRVQERLETNKQIGRANAPSKLQELAGKIKCKKCGYAIKSYSTSTNGMPYLSCYGNYGLKSCDCTFHGIKFWDVQKKVGEEIQSQLDLIEQLVEEEHHKAVNHQKTIEKIQQDMKHLLELESLGGKSVHIVHQKLEELQTKIDELELDEFMDLNIIDKIYSSESLPLVYDNFTNDEKKNICQELIEKIYLSSNGDIEIVWNI